MAGLSSGELRIQSRVDTQPLPSYELGRALIGPSFRIVDEVGVLSDSIGSNDDTSYPMEAAGGNQPEPVSVFTVRRLDTEQAPVETIQVVLTDRNTAQIIHNNEPIATFNRDRSIAENHKWERVSMPTDSPDDATLSFDEMLHGKITFLANQSGYRDKPKDCAAAFQAHLDVHPIEDVFIDNHALTNNHSTLKP